MSNGHLKKPDTWKQYFGFPLLMKLAFSSGILILINRITIHGPKFCHRESRGRGMKYGFIFSLLIHILLRTNFLNTPQPYTMFFMNGFIFG
jgi:uncharacterized membrane protein YobD (UPF0266 family)